MAGWLNRRLPGNGEVAGMVGGPGLQKTSDSSGQVFKNKKFFEEFLKNCDKPYQGGQNPGE